MFIEKFKTAFLKATIKANIITLKFVSIAYGHPVYESETEFSETFEKTTIHENIFNLK